MYIIFSGHQYNKMNDKKKTILLGVGSKSSHPQATFAKN